MMTAKTPFFWRNRLVLAAVLLALAAMMPMLWQFVWRVPGKADFLLHHSEYQHVVTAVKSLGITPEKRIELDG